MRNVAAYYGGTIAEATVFFLLTPFMIRYLGLAGFGLWWLAVSLAEWLQLCDFGLREAVLKYTAAHQARSELAAVRRVADTALFFYSLAGLIALAAGAVLTWFVLPLLVQGSNAISVTRSALAVLCVSAALSLPAGLGGVLLEGLARFDLINLFRVGFALLRMVLVVLALQAETGFLGIAFAELVARLVLHICRWVAVARISPLLLPRAWPHHLDRGLLLGFSSWNALRQVANAAVTRLYEPIVAYAAGPAAVGALYAGRRLGSVPAEMIVPLSVVLFPLSSELEASRRQQALRQSLLKSTKIALLLSMPTCLVLALGAGPILANWLGGRVPEAEPVLVTFSIFFLLVATVLPAEAILLGLGHVRLLAMLALVHAGVTAGLGVPLTIRFGPAGLGMAAIVAVTVSQVLVQIPLAARSCALPMSHLLRKAILPPLLAAVPAALGMFFLRDMIAVGGVAALLAWSGAGVGTYALLLWWFGFDDEERAFLRSHFNRLVLDRSKITDWDDSL